MSIRQHKHAIALILATAATGISGCADRAPVSHALEPVAPTAPSKPKPKLALPEVKFVDVTSESGLHFTHHNASTGEKLLPETMGSGVAFIDYDRDGDQDLFFVDQGSWPGAKGTPASRSGHALYRNDGSGHFKDVTEEAGLGSSVFGQGVAVGDYDNNGADDLFVTALGGCQLFRNDGGKFTDVAREAGALDPEGWPTSAAFLDMENDGDLDLFLCSYVSWSAEIDRSVDTRIPGGGLAFDPPTAFDGSFCRLLRNDGGKFTDVSETAGIRIRAGELKAPMAKSLGVAPLDIDGDGLVDLAVANDTAPNFLFHNLGGGKFEDIGLTAGVAFGQAGQTRGAMGADWADFHNDGTVGLAVANFANEMVALYVADGPNSLQFTDMAAAYGLGLPTQSPLKFGLFFFDYDLDGRLDLLTANGHLERDVSKLQASQSYEQPAQLLWNTGEIGPHLFVLVDQAHAGPDLFKPLVGRGSAYADIDGDGDLDVVITSNGGPARLFRNDGGDKNGWIRLTLKGTQSNRDGIGAKVVVTAGGVTQTRQLFPAKGYLSSVELPLTFGLGRAGKADRVTVTWPSGENQEWKDLRSGTKTTLEENSANPGP
jgi:hypothetical protein